MKPADLALIVQGVQLAISAAPQIEEIVIKAKDFIASLASNGVITSQQQNAVHSHVDAICAATLAGEKLPEWQAWQVEPDPAA